LEASILGVYIHGLSGDVALNEQSEESLVAGDLINNFGKAFKKLKT
jgi:NAD(P)H-hydrate epimerase